MIGLDPGRMIISMVTKSKCLSANQTVYQSVILCSFTALLTILSGCQTEPIIDSGNDVESIPSQSCPSDFIIESVPKTYARDRKLSFFTRYVNVFDINIFASSDAIDRDILRIANMLAAYLDSDLDGIPDNPDVMNRLNADNVSLCVTLHKTDMKKYGDSYFVVLMSDPRKVWLFRSSVDIHLLINSRNRSTSCDIPRQFVF